MGEFDHPPVDLSPSPPTPPAQDFYTYLDYNSYGCHLVLSPHPWSFGPFYPLYFGVLCSSVLDLTCDVHEHKVLDGIGVEKETYDINFL